MATGLGVSPDAVDEMTVERVDDLVTYWREYPPPHILVRAAVGFKSDAADENEPPPIGAL